LLHHGTLLRIDTHYTDTGGATDHVFALCTLLGFRFCPRLRDLPERKLACIVPASTYPHQQPLLGQRIKTEVIREHWGEILRLVASLKAGTVAPSAMLRKLAAYDRQNQLDLALQELGRIERTLFMLDWLESHQRQRDREMGSNTTGGDGRGATCSRQIQPAPAPQAMDRPFSTAYCARGARLSLPRKPKARSSPQHPRESGECRFMGTRNPFRSNSLEVIVSTRYQKR
jgi:hypothetical protein